MRREKFIAGTGSWGARGCCSRPSPYFMTFIVVLASLSTLLHYVYIFHGSFVWFRFYFLPVCSHYFNKLYFLDGNGIISLYIIPYSGGASFYLLINQFLDSELQSFRHCCETKASKQKKNFWQNFFFSIRNNRKRTAE